MTSEEEDERVAKLSHEMGDAIFKTIHDFYCKIAKEGKVADLSIIHGMTYAIAFAVGNLVNNAHGQRLSIEAVGEIAEFGRDEIYKAMVSVYEKYAPGQDGFKALPP